MAIKPIPTTHERLRDIQGSRGLHSYAALGFSAVGRYVVPDTDFDGGDALTLTPSEMILKPLYVPRRTSFDRIAVHVTLNGGAGSTIRFGIYLPNDSLDPGALLADLGTIAGNGGTGIRALTISRTLNEGLYFLTAVGQGVNLPDVIQARRVALTLIRPNATFVDRSVWRNAAVAGALPDPAGASFADGFFGATVGLRIA